MKKKKCKGCKQELDGEMLFYPEYCLDCVIQMDPKENEKK